MPDVRPQQLSPASLPAQRASRVASSTPAAGSPHAGSPRARSPRTAGSRAIRSGPFLPGRAVVFLALLSTASLALLDRSWTGRLSQFFDLCFVLVCIVAALAVRRSGLFTVGVTPPLVLVTVLSAFTIVDPATLTAEHLAFISTLLTGLAHHAAALVAGHGSALAILVARGTIGDATGPEPF